MPANSETNSSRPLDIPFTFKSPREQLVHKFTSILFPSDGQDYPPFIFVNSPPWTGKASFMILLHNHLLDCFPNMPVVKMPALRLDDSSHFPVHFKKLTLLDHDEFFINRSNDRVLLITGSFVGKEDKEDLWTDLLKEAIGGQYEGLRVVFSASCCQFNGTLFGVQVPMDRVYGFLPDPNTEADKPCLQVTRQEVEEMIAHGVTIPPNHQLNSPQNTRLAPKVADLIWVLCDRHVSIAWSILVFLSRQFGNRTDEVSREELQFELQGVELLNFLAKRFESVPSAYSVVHIFSKRGGTSFAAQELIIKVLSEVAYGAQLLPGDVEERAGGPEAIDRLTRYGFLYVGKEGWLLFPSNMHRKVWLVSSREKPSWKSLVDHVHETVLKTALDRLSAEEMRMAYMRSGSVGKKAKELQMLLFKAVCSCLPRTVVVTQEWPAPDGAGFVGIVISRRSEVWLWKLQVDAGSQDMHVDADDSVFYAGTSPNTTMGNVRKYTKRTSSFHVVLINIGGSLDGASKDDQVCVTFTEDFASANVVGEGLYMNIMLKPSVSGC